jgi:hypothetical protein
VPVSVFPSLLKRLFLIWQEFQMSSIEQRIVAVTDSTANLVAQLRELDQLREQVRKALLLRAPRLKRPAGRAPLRVFF